MKYFYIFVTGLALTLLSCGHEPEMISDRQENVPYLDHTDGKQFNLAGSGEITSWLGSDARYLIFNGFQRAVIGGTYQWRLPGSNALQTFDLGTISLPRVQRVPLIGGGFLENPTSLLFYTSAIVTSNGQEYQAEIMLEYRDFLPNGQLYVMINNSSWSGITGPVGPWPEYQEPTSDSQPSQRPQQQMQQQQQQKQQEQIQQRQGVQPQQQNQQQR